MPESSHGDKNNELCAVFRMRLWLRLRPGELRTWREGLGWSIDKLVEEILKNHDDPDADLHPITCERWESGKSTPSRKYVIALQKVLEEHDLDIYEMRLRSEDEIVPYYWKNDALNGSVTEKGEQHYES